MIQIAGCSHLQAPLDYGFGMCIHYYAMNAQIVMKAEPATLAKSVLIAAALLAVPGAGRADIIYEDDYFGNNIDHFDSVTGTYLGPFANTDLSGPAEMAFDSTGNLFVSDYFGNYITKFAPDGTGSVFATGLSTPSGLAFDKAGNLYVANFTGNDIIKFTRAAPVRFLPT
jgi:hypothetical protein